MKLLLDTHAFIWWDSEPAKLPGKTLALCQDQANTVLVSVASVWEMQIKLQLGKLKLNLSLAEMVESQRQTNNIEVLPIFLAHTLALENLPAHHKDPFDRLLIAHWPLSWWSERKLLTRPTSVTGAIASGEISAGPDISRSKGNQCRTDHSESVLPGQCPCPWSIFPG